MTNRVLKLVSNGGLVLPPSPGYRRIEKEEYLFKVIDKDFRTKTGDVRKSQKPTKSFEVEVYEITKDARFSEMLCLKEVQNSGMFTEEQIVVFCMTLRNWITDDGIATFLPLVEDGLVSVVGVSRTKNYLNIYKNRFDFGHPWECRDKHRLVVPKIG